MRFSLLISIVSGILAAPAVSQDQSAQILIQALQSSYKANTASQYTSNCTMANVVKRKSWTALGEHERTQYLQAVQCLDSKPAKTDPSLCPGCRTRRDDFVYAHVIQSNFVHVSALFLPWHRGFIKLYEDALRNECGLTIAQPYWDWAEHASNQTESPVFDGSATSFGSDGIFIPDRAPEDSNLVDLTVNGSAFIVTRYPGSGGGCVTDGFFSNLTLNIGPVSPANNTADNKYGLKYNPRCITHDFNSSQSASGLNYTAVLNLLSQPDIHSFHTLLENTMHPTSHSVVGGSLFDFYTGPNDPTFFLLHANHDRLWAIWQGQDYVGRTNDLDGTATFENSPPSEIGTLSTVMIFNEAGPDSEIGTAMKAVGAPGYCYIYE